MQLHRLYRVALAALGLASVLVPAPARASEPAQARASEPVPVGASKVVRPYAEGTPPIDIPAEMRGVEIVERVGETIPRDLRFVDAGGRAVTIGELLDGGLPVILTFNYSSCPMLCSAQLRALTEAMGKIPFEAGVQYRIVTIGLSPRESAQSAAETKTRYLETFPAEKRAKIASGWHFVVGEEASIRAMADAVGLHYRFIEETGEYAHPAALIFLSPGGVVTRYYHGITYEPDVLGPSIFQAGAGKYGISVGFLLACFQPGEHQNYARVGEQVMRYGTISFVVVLLAAFGAWQWARARKSHQECSKRL